MAKVLLLTNTLGASAEVLPALGLLQHQVKILPAEASVLVDAPDVDLVLIDARRDLPAVKSLTKLLHSTGVGCPIVAITTEGGCGWQKTQQPGSGPLGRQPGNANRSAQGALGQARCMSVRLFQGNPSPR